MEISTETDSKRRPFFSLDHILYIDPSRDRSRPREKAAGLADAGALLALTAMAATLPYPEITSVREIAVFWGLICWVAGMALRREWTFLSTPLNLPLALWFLVCALSFFSAVDPGYTAGQLFGELLYHIILFFTAVHTVRTNTRLAVALAGFVAGIAAMDVYSVIDFTINGGSWRGSNIRMMGTYESNAQFWTYLIQSLPIMAFMIFAGRKRFWSVVAAVILFLHIACIYATFSRMAMVAMAVQVIFILYFLGVPKKWLALGLAIAVVGMAVFLPRQIIKIGKAGPHDIQVGKIAIHGIKGTRSKLWAQAWEQIREHPITGLGYGRRSFHKKYPELTKIETELWHPHNTFLTLTVNLGIQGLLVFLFILYRCFRYLWPDPNWRPNWHSRNASGLVVASALVMLVGFITNNMTNDLYTDDTALQFWLMIGLAFSVRPRMNPEPLISD